MGVFVEIFALGRQIQHLPDAQENDVDPPWTQAPRIAPSRLEVIREAVDVLRADVRKIQMPDVREDTDPKNAQIVRRRALGHLRLHIGQPDSQRKILKGDIPRGFGGEVLPLRPFGEAFDIVESPQTHLAFENLRLSLTPLAVGSRVPQPGGFAAADALIDEIIVERPVPRSDVYPWCFCQVFCPPASAQWSASEKSAYAKWVSGNACPIPIPRR